MNILPDYMATQFANNMDSHGNQKLFLPDASLSFNFKPDSSKQANYNNQHNNNMSNLVNMPQFCMLLDSHYSNNPNSNVNMHQNPMYTDSVPIIDLVQKSDEPYVICKLPVQIYNRVVEMMHLKTNIQIDNSMEVHMHSPIHTSTATPSAGTPVPSSASSPLMTNPFISTQQQQLLQSPLPPKHAQMQLTPASSPTPGTPTTTPIQLNASLPQKLANLNTNTKSDEEYHIKGSWTEEEDKKLVELVKKYGAKRWSFIASHLKGRIGKQCRERYLNHLDPKINKKAWTPHEDSVIVEMHSKHGNQWAKISRMLPGRTANAIKNHWNSTLSRRLEKLKRSPGGSPLPNDEDSMESNGSDSDNYGSQENNDGQQEGMHHVVINPPPLPQPQGTGPFSGTSSSSTTRVLGGFNNIGATQGSGIMDMPKFEIFPANNNFSTNAKKRLRLEDEDHDHDGEHEEHDIHSDVHNFDEHHDLHHDLHHGLHHDLHHDLDDEHHMEDLHTHSEEHANKRFKPHVLDLTQSHSDSSKLKLETEERIYNPFSQEVPQTSRGSLTLKSPNERSNDGSDSTKYKSLTLNLDEGTHHDFDFNVICHNNAYDCGLNLAEDNVPQGSQRRPSIVQATQPSTPSNLTTPSNLNTPSGSHIQEFFSESLWSPKSVKNSSVKQSNLLHTCS
jgi:hypothetical protein